ncbi:hypothetical protein AHF37_11637, partial [Paragonimus kellicotti]
NDPIRFIGKCSVCERLIQPTNCLLLGGRLYHYECVRCSVCCRRLGRYSVRELNGRAYCPEDYANTVACSGQFYFDISVEIS